MPALALQRCLNHTSREAVARCPECAQFYCRECITEHDERVICAACLQKIVQTATPVVRRRVNLWPVFQMTSGVVVACCAFYLLGRLLLALPDSFHDGSLWQMDYSSAEEDDEP